MEPWIELLVLAAAAARVARTLAMPAARRELRRPRVALLAVAGGLAGIVTIAWAAVASIALLRALATCVVLAWALAAWRARPAYGRRRGLPPGSLGVESSLRAIVDPEFYAREARRHGPVFKMAQFHRSVVCVLGLERGRRVLHDHEDALAPPPLPLAQEVPRSFLRYMTPEDHAKYARLFRSAFSEAALGAIAPAAAREADRALAALASAGPAGVSPRDILHDHVLAVLLRLFFGGLLHAEDHATVAALAADADYAGAVGRPSQRARDALRRFEELVATRRAAYEAREDPSVWGEIARLDPAAAGDQTVVGNLFLMLLAAWDSIACLVCWTVQLLGTAPAWVDVVRRGPATNGDDPFARAVLETLRLAQSEYVYREVRRPIAIDGFTIPAGWFFRLLVAESHRLDPPFERPDVFDPDRHRQRRWVTAELAPFGFDQHACLGARTTLVVARHFAERLVRGYTWTVVDDGPRERGNRHWNHWQPSARFRIALTPHAEAR